MTTIDPAWRPADAPRQDGRLVVVTGASSGLGAETAFAAAGRGATVVLAARSAARTGAVIDRIRAAHPEARVEHLPLDLADLGDVARAAADLVARHPRIDVLVANAGVMGTPLRRTGDGFELQQATNHLGHQALVGRLLDALGRGGGADGDGRGAARVVLVSSELHRAGRVDPDDVAWQGRPYRRWGAYAASKLANLLFARELDRRLAAAGAPIAAVAAHPGFAATGLQAAGAGLAGTPAARLRAAVSDRATRLVAQPAWQGALPQLYAALMPDAPRGGYLGPAGRGGMRGGPALVVPSAAARDAALAAAVWDATEALTGVRTGL